MRMAFGGWLSAWLIALATGVPAPNGPLADTLHAPSLTVVKYDLATNQDIPELCFLLSEPVARQTAQPLASYVSAEPAAKLIVRAENHQLCVTGLAFGNVYNVSLKTGLPGTSTILAKDWQVRAPVPNRPPELSFAAPAGDLLPRLGAGGLPIRSVNLPKIEAAVFRISDRDLLLTSRAAISGRDLANSTNRRGELVWRGSIEPRGGANRDVLTPLPIETTPGQLKPGLYAAAIWPSDTPIGAEGPDLPTQYFTVSDIGLIAYRTPTGLVASLHSLASAAAIGGADVALIARNNRELGRVRTDSAGFARFDPSTLAGTEGDRPAALFAYGAAGDFTFLALDGPPGASGDAGDQPSIAPPGRATIIADRTAYRPGETVRAIILLRNDLDAAVPKLPMTARITRPGGVLFNSQTLTDQDGGYSLAFDLPDETEAGDWRIEAYATGGGEPLGSSRFSVVPAEAEGLDISVTADSAAIDPSQPGSVSVQSQYGSGRPAAGEPGDIRVTLAPAANPFPAFATFSFGLAEENIAPVSSELVHLTMDAGGKARVPLKLPELPQTTRPLEAQITARMPGAAGRPSERTITIPVANQSLLLGIKPSAIAAAGEWLFSEGQPAHFDLIAVSPDGGRQDKPGVVWEILREDEAPFWYWDGNRFACRSSIKDVQVATGTVDIPAGPAAAIQAPLPSGHYRIEVFDPKGEAVTSGRFTVGALPGIGDEQMPRVDIKPGKPFYAAGEAADIFIKPPFESDVILASADRQLRDPIVQHVPAGGATMHLELPRDWTGGLSFTATALAPPVAAAPGLPRRAIGAAWVPPDPALRRLDVKLDLPEQISPQQTLSVAVTVNGAGDEPVLIYLSAIDDGPVNAGKDRDLRDFQQDRPEQPITAYDVYSRIISSSPSTGGGDRGAAAPGANLVQSSQYDKPPGGGARFSYRSEILALDKSGKGVVQIPVTDFSGALRVWAVAWSLTRTGQAEAKLDVHYPLKAELPVPADLAPEDRVDLTLALDNAEGPRGEYHVRVHAEGAASVQDESEFIANLAEHEKRTQPVTIQAHGPGDASVIISVQGPGGIAFERRIGLTVRPPVPSIVRYATSVLKPGAVLTVDPTLTTGMRPDSIVAAVMVSAGTDFDLRGVVPTLIAANYGSIEQIIGAATPYFASPALWPSGTADNNSAAAHLERAAERLFALQNQDGGFSLFGGAGSDPWLSAYTVDFLGRAKAAGASISDEPMRRALDYLALHAEPPAQPAASTSEAAASGQDALEAVSFAAKVLAANGRLSIFQLRYFSDRFGPSIRTVSASFWIAAAYAALGDKATALSFFTQALSASNLPAAADSFSSDLRDQAMLTALMAESGVAPQALLQAAAGKTAAIAASHRQFSLQEATWIFRAQAALPATSALTKLKVGDKVEQAGPVRTVAAGAGIAGLPPIKNLAELPVHAAISVVGTPAQTEAREAGYEAQRWLFDTTGKPIDPSAIRQNDLIVVVLTGRFTGERDPHPWVTDPLPAGWKMLAAAPIDPASRFPWLKDLTGAIHAESRDGRYIAAPNLVGERHEFKLAYIARAELRGQFTLPGTIVEDLNQPALSARGANGKTKIDSPP